MKYLNTCIFGIALWHFVYAAIASCYFKLFGLKFSEAKTLFKTKHDKAKAHLLLIPLVLGIYVTAFICCLLFW